MPENDNESTEGQADIKELREAAGRSKEHKAEADTAKRELAFVKAGYDTDHPLVSQLMSSYTGDLTKDAVKGYMDGLDVAKIFAAPAAEETTTTTTAGQESAATEEERTQARERTGAIDGGESAGVPAEDPRRVGLAKAFDIIEAGGSREDGTTAFLNELFGAAVAGDRRVLTANIGGNYAS